MQENPVQQEAYVIPKNALAGLVQANSALPAPSILTYYNLYEKRHLVLDFEVSDDITDYQKNILLWNLEDRDIAPEDRKPIWLFIHSPGGDADYMWSMIDSILLSDTPVYTVNMGMAASAASLIFIAGHKRFMFPRAKVLIHEGAASMSGDSIKVLDASDSYRKELKRMREFILERTNIPASTLSRKRSNDWEIDAKDCLDYGVCDQIVTSYYDLK